MTDDVDTVTPLDVQQEGLFEPDYGNVAPEDYTTQGKTTVATRSGYRFVPSDKSLPVITSTGVKVTAAQADSLVNESGGLVHVEKED